MPRKVLITSTMLADLSGAVAAESIADQAINALKGQNYSRLEVENGLSQVKVEGTKNGRRLEVVYDATTGAIIKQEVYTLRAGDNDRPGVRIRNVSDDFTHSRGRDDDDHDRSSSRSDDNDDRARSRADDDDDRKRERKDRGRDDNKSDDREDDHDDD